MSTHVDLERKRKAKQGKRFNIPVIEYVVEEVTRTHQAEVYEMKTVERPEKTIARMIELRCPTGKLRARLLLDQLSSKRVQTSRIGTDNRLL